MKTINITSPSPINRLFHLTKDVKTYQENFASINFKIIGCQECGSVNVVRHGTYFRIKAGVRIQRLYCNDCGSSRGWLPPFLLPYKHYPVNEVLPVVKRYLLGTTGTFITWLNTCRVNISFSTFRRWLKTLSQMAGKLHNIARRKLAQHKPFWRFEKDSRLSSAAFPMAGNPDMNELYQIFIMEDYFVFESVKRDNFFVWLIFQSRLRT
ncbi:MAG: DUF6431 domain-containing protein [Elusimicrobiota bacterium]|nr:DUF6431 domain-containing protein [Elusimicrobiota bacterium]